MAWLRDARVLMESILQWSKFGPPSSFAPALVGMPPIHSVPSDQKFMDRIDLIRGSQIVLGVPKFRTCKPRKQTRKFGFPKLLTLKHNLVNCSTCGDVHELHTVCGTCYNVVKTETDGLKRTKLGLKPLP